MTVRPAAEDCEPPAGNKNGDESDTGDHRRALLTLRAAVIFTAALVIGAGAGILTWLASRRPAAAVLAGAAA
jgi:hypothetical protein